MRVPPGYDVAIALYVAAIRMAALFQPKARSWVNGRKSWVANLEKGIADFPSGARRIWIHCASLGEFEQGRPLIEALRKAHPDSRILLSFFSPSGYELRKDYPAADYIFYLPADTRANARRLVETVKPDLVIFVKYEFWLNTLSTLFERKVPVLLVSALFRPGQVFFRPYGKTWLEALRRFRHIFVQDAASKALLESYGLNNSTVAGDTRVDRVLQLVTTAVEIPEIKQFAGEAALLIAGSTWPPDEAILVDLLKNGFPKGWKLVIAPHEPGEASLRHLEKLLPCASLRFSQLHNGKTPDDATVLLIDNVGMLAALYKYGIVAYIGGGFGAGIHNTLEPMAFGLPVMFGPRHQKFREAVEMVAAGAAISVKNADALREAMNRFQSVEQCMEAIPPILNYLSENRGATDKIMKFVAEEILNT
ncbi:MAG: 3-deoxy-D-manno-octulosonic acid transferase [Saprospiraceae bacterium]|nr:3-deoxy-D-manno-octulosonic acid transferase [Saprospiraceae bacterium]